MTLEQFLAQFPEYSSLEQEVVEEAINKASELVPRDLWGEKSLSCIAIYANTILKVKVQKPINLVDSLEEELLTS